MERKEKLVVERARGGILIKDCPALKITRSVAGGKRN